MAKKQILFIHSAGRQGPGPHDGSAGFLEFLTGSFAGDYEVKHPLMPTPSAPSYASWGAEFGSQFNTLDDGAILIGHSLGGSVILKYLSEHKILKSIAGVFIAASPYWGADKDWQVPEYNLRDNFTSHLPASRYFFYQSRDDEVVAQSHFEKYAREMPQATARLVDAGGHQLKKGLPELVEDVKSL